MKLHKRDVTSENGFPGNVDIEKNIVVQIPKSIFKKGIILYFCSIDGSEEMDYWSDHEKYDHGLYIFRGD